MKAKNGKPPTYLFTYDYIVDKKPKGHIDLVTIVFPTVFLVKCVYHVLFPFILSVNHAMSVPVINSSLDSATFIQIDLQKSPTQGQQKINKIFEVDF